MMTVRNIKCPNHIRSFAEHVEQKLKDRVTTASYISLFRTTKVDDSVKIGFETVILQINVFHLGLHL